MSTRKPYWGPAVVWGMRGAVSHENLRCIRTAIQGASRDGNPEPLDVLGDQYKTRVDDPERFRVARDSYFAQREIDQYWVTESVTGLVLESARRLPGETTVSSLMPWSGFAVLESAVSFPAAVRSGGDAGDDDSSPGEPVDAVMWQRLGDELVITPATRDSGFVDVFRVTRLYPEHIDWSATIGESDGSRRHALASFVFAFVGFLWSGSDAVTSRIDRWNGEVRHPWEQGEASDVITVDRRTDGPRRG